MAMGSVTEAESGSEVVKVSKMLKWVCDRGWREANVRRDHERWVYFNDLVECKYFSKYSAEQLIQLIHASNKTKQRFEIRDCKAWGGKEMRTVAEAGFAQRSSGWKKQHLRDREFVADERKSDDFQGQRSAKLGVLSPDYAIPIGFQSNSASSSSRSGFGVTPPVKSTAIGHLADHTPPMEKQVNPLGRSRVTQELFPAKLDTPIRQLRLADEEFRGPAPGAIDLAQLFPQLSTADPLQTLCGDRGFGGDRGYDRGMAVGSRADPNFLFNRYASYEAAYSSRDAGSCLYPPRPPFAPPPPVNPYWYHNADRGQWCQAAWQAHGDATRNAHCAQKLEKPKLPPGPVNASMRVPCAPRFKDDPALSDSELERQTRDILLGSGFKSEEILSVKVDETRASCIVEVKI